MRWGHDILPKNCLPKYLSVLETDGTGGPLRSGQSGS